MVSKSHTLSHAFRSVLTELSWYQTEDSVQDIHLIQSILLQELKQFGFVVQDIKVFFELTELVSKAAKLDTYDLFARDKHFRKINTLGAQCLTSTK